MKKIIVALLIILTTTTIAFANGVVETVIDKSVEIATNINDDIEKFEITWDKDNLNISSVTAELTIMPSRKSVIEVTVSSDKREDSFQLKKGEDLKTQFEKKEKDREITIFIPESFLTNLKINTVTGDLNLSNFNLKELTADSVSGDLNIVNTNVDNLFLNITSGEILVDNVTVKEKLITEAATGEISIRNTKADSLKVDYTTNTATVVNSEFNNVDVDGVSGRFRGNFTFNTLSVDVTTGSIELEVDNVNNYSYQISSMGEIKVGDITTKGSYFKSENNGKAITINSTASKVKIY